MNGRAYDYNLGRFLSVDPFIQEPGNSQSMNPYSYIMNNPLAGTDPSGYEGVGIRQEQYIMYKNPEFAAGLKELRIKQAEAALETAILIDTISDYVAPVKGIIKKGIKETIKAGIKKAKELLGKKKVEVSNGRDASIKNNGDPSKIGDDASKATKQRNKPPEPLKEAEGRPHTIVEKKGENGQYTTHNGDGTYKQYRGEGKPHGNIERPNVKETKNNTNPKGETYPGKPKVRPAKEEEIPKPPKKPDEKL